MNVIVTGGHGFVGKHVCDRLRVAGHRPGQMHGGGGGTDVRLVDQFTGYVLDARPDAIIHVAATCGGIGANAARPGTFFRDNMQMAIAVLEAARLATVPRTILVGSVCSYPKHCATPFLERDLWLGHPEETNAPYGIAKRAMFTMAEGYREEFDVDSICLIPANMYGPGDNFDLETSHVIPAMIRKFADAKRAGSLPVTLWGDGSPTREFLYVEDAANAIVRAISAEPVAGPINVGTGHAIRIADLAEMVAAIVGYDGPVVWDTSKPNGQPRRQLDTERAAARLGWRATTALHDGLRKTIDWVAARQS